MTCFTCTFSSFLRKSQHTEVTCVPNMLVLGIHKCGTTDLRMALNSLKFVDSRWYEPYLNYPKHVCPKDYFDSIEYKTARKKWVNIIILVIASKLVSFIILIVTNMSMHTYSSQYHKESKSTLNRFKLSGGRGLKHQTRILPQWESDYRVLQHNSSGCEDRPDCDSTILLTSPDDTSS